MEKNEVILVDKKDRKIGVEEKLKAHREGKLHRCFSIFIFNKNRELLIQRRAKTKYHSGGLWSNTCCSHPLPGKNLVKEAQRRLKEEMGIKSNLKEIFSFIYKSKVKAKRGYLIEHEFDHVFVGKFNGNPKPDSAEAEDWKWVTLKELKKDVKKNPKKYSEWFRIILNKLIKEYGFQ